jgi:hypothetical protein
MSPSELNGLDIVGVEDEVEDGDTDGDDAATLAGSFVIM